jgi:hypothetical protein
MNWGRAQLESVAKCSIRTDMEVVELNNVPQVCYSGTGEDGIIKFIVENGANIDIQSLQLRIIGTKEIYTTKLSDSFVEKGYTLQKVVPYNFNIFGKIRQIKLSPYIMVYANEPHIVCPEQGVTIENVREC